MARVLCAWEFGGGLGHIRRLLPIALELRAMGHEVSIALRDSAFLEAARGQGFETFVAPLLRAPPAMNPSPISLSDVLLNLGFDDRRGLAGALRAWRCLMELLGAEVLVADYAPTASIAARAAGIRRVTVGSGFSLPVMQDPLPALRPWTAPDPAVLRALDDRLVASVRSALSMPPSQEPERARDLFSADAHVLCTFAEIDPFGAREGVEYVGPLEDASPAIDVDWSRGSGDRVLAYLKPEGARFDAVLAGLAALDAEVIVAVPGLAPERARSASGARMRVFDVPVNVDALLADASLCVTHAGPGMVARALACGVPMALLPLQLEQFLVARRVAEGGSGVVSSPEEAAPDFREWFASLLANRSLRDAAANRALAHRAHSFAEATRLVARRIDTVARS
ncbi:MAG: glycosyltransferase [Usitatibacter sp.]